VSGYSNPRDMLVQQLAELLFVERMLFNEVLPALHDDAHDPALQEALTAHRGETRMHVSRVEDALRAVGIEPTAARSATLVKMKEEHETESGSVKHATLRDVFHCAGAARTEHFELALYDAAIGLAKELGHHDCAKLLEKNRSEDAGALKAIGKLAGRLRGDLPK
jgi:ferritin-like metal-binding protein YciE